MLSTRFGFQCSQIKRLKISAGKAFRPRKPERIRRNSVQTVALLKQSESRYQDVAWRGELTGFHLLFEEGLQFRAQRYGDGHERSPADQIRASSCRVQSWLACASESPLLVVTVRLI